MYMRLIYADDREHLEVSLSEIEDPFFARHYVEQALNSPFDMLCLIDIEAEGPRLTREQILDAVEAGDILLVTDDPFNPLSQDTFNEYPHITGRGWSGAFHRPVELEKPPLPEAEPIVRPQPQEPGFYIVPKSTTGPRTVRFNIALNQCQAGIQKVTYSLKANTTGTDFKIPLPASYYRLTTAELKAGSANTEVTFTVNYL